MVDSAFSDDFDIRVSKALGSRGYDKVRLSIISNGTISGLSDIFDYSSQFQYKWTSKYLSTGIISVTPGKATVINITPDKTVTVTLPVENAGVVGVIISDPCITSEWVKCDYKDKFQSYDRTIALLNAINSHQDVSFWEILGDNFYDQSGDVTGTLFNALSQETKSKILHTVPGNHDYWVHGAPYLHVSNDQLGNGFMQFYGQDVVASSANPSQPYDFSIDPSSSTIISSALPPLTNFFFYHKIGNIGFIGYTGTSTFEEHQSYVEEACAWAETAQVDSLLLLGHWYADGLGCDADAAVPAFYEEMIALPACKSIAPKLKYFTGHVHCNRVIAPDIGFLIGGWGMASSSDCIGQFGFSVVDSTNGYLNVYYFPVAEFQAFDNYDVIMECLQNNGVSGCYSLATLWSSTPL